MEPTLAVFILGAIAVVVIFYFRTKKIEEPGKTVLTWSIPIIVSILFFVLSLIIIYLQGARDAELIIMGLVFLGIGIPLSVLVYYGVGFLSYFITLELLGRKMSRTTLYMLIPVGIILAIIFAYFAIFLFMSWFRPS